MTVAVNVLAPPEHISALLATTVTDGLLTILTLYATVLVQPLASIVVKIMFSPSA